MSKLFLGLIAFSCLLAFTVAADATNQTVVQTEYFTNYQCTGTPFFASNSTTGCHSLSANYPSSDRAYVLQYSYSAADCPTVNITFITQVPVGVCGGAGAYGGYWFRYTIFTNVVDPAAPTAFPPASGFSTRTLYLNSTDSTPSTTCSSTGTRTIISAYPTPAAASSCVVNDASIGGSQQYFTSNGCTTRQVVQYSDAACQTPVRLATTTVEFKTCSNGYAVTCTDTGAASVPSTLSVGFTQYDNNQCTANSNTESTFAVSGACYDKSTLTCGTVNGTSAITYNQYNTKDCTGTVVSTISVPADGSPSCIITGDIKNVTATCNANPNSGNSASTASVSAIVMIVAAFVALIAGRQL